MDRTVIRSQKLFGPQKVRQSFYRVFSQLGVMAGDASIFAALSLVCNQTLCSDWAVPDVGKLNPNMAQDLK